MPSKRVLMEKNRLQLELKLQSDLMVGLKRQGWFVTKTSDRFKAGRPDLRTSHNDFGQLDVELKYSVEQWHPDAELDTGLSKLQWLKMREMNQNGIPTIGLVYCEPNNLFFVTTVLRETLPPTARCVSYLKSEVLHGPNLFVVAMSHLRDLGYHRR